MNKLAFAGAASALLVLLAACEKTSEKETGGSTLLQLEDVHAVITADIAPAEGASSGLFFPMEAGDRLLLRVTDKTYAGASEADVFTISETADKVSLEGDIQYAADRDIVAGFFNSGGFSDAARPVYAGAIPASQSGKLEDIREIGLFQARVYRKDIGLKDGQCDFSVTLKPFFAVVKLTVPSSLAAQTLTAGAGSAQAGDYTLDMQDYLLSRSSKSDVITVSGGESDLGGQDIYLVLAPDSYDSMTGEYYCSATSLVWTFYDSEGRVDRYETVLDARLYCGTFTDLGEVPDYVSFDKPAVSGYLKLLEENTVRIGVADTALLSTFYYELGADEESCATPTAESSPSFYACSGFEVPCTRSYDAWYVKVLVHSGSLYSGDIILKGYVRNWNFGNGTPVTDAIARAASLFPAVGDSYYVDGMHLQRTNKTALSYIQYDDCMQLRTCYLAMDAVVRNNADGWLYFKVNKRLARGYKLYNNNATYGTTTFNGYAVTASVAKDASDPYGQVPVVWQLGEVTEGYMFGVRGDGIHDYYNMAFLETGQSVKAPEEPTTGVSVKFEDGSINPVMVIDSTAVAASISSGAKYYYLTSRDGFDAMGDPTVDDAQLTSDGLVIPFESATDRVYFKILGHCDGMKDSFLKVVVRNWKFDKNFIAPTTLVSEYDGLTLKLNTSYSNEMVAYNRVGYDGFNAGTATVHPLMSGFGWVYSNQFAGSFNGTSFSIYNDDALLYHVNMPGSTYYHDNTVIGVAPTGDISPSSAIVYEWTYKLWMEDLALMEENLYMPSSYADGGKGDGIEDFIENPAY